MRDVDWPGARIVKAEGSVNFAALLREYLTLTLVKAGLALSLVVMAKVLVGKECRVPWGSLMSLSVSSPVLVMVVTTFKFSMPLTAAGPVMLSDRPGAAETVVVATARAINEDQRELKNMLITEGKAEYNSNDPGPSGEAPTPTASFYTTVGCVNSSGGLQWLTTPRVQDDLRPETPLRRQVIPRR